MNAALLNGIAASPWALTVLRYITMALAVLSVLLSLRGSGERAGRVAERLESVERTHDVQRRMLEAATRRPRDRDDFADRLRDGRL